MDGNRIPSSRQFIKTQDCALDENDSDANLFLARMNEAETQAAVLLGIDDPNR
jgi:hypothetical protein